MQSGFGTVWSARRSGGLPREAKAMNTTTKRIIISATLVAATSTSATFVAASSAGVEIKPVSPAPASRVVPYLTPDDCIRMNGGDYNACNVGNSGRGDLPYRLVSAPAQFASPRKLLR
jgi:hypothetical protein